MPLTITTARALQPVTLAEAKLHLRVDISDDDALITALIIAATDDAEHLMNRAILPQTWQLTMDSWGDDATPGTTSAIYLPRPTVTSITSVKYLQAGDGVLTTMSGSDYVLAAADPYIARVVPAYGKYWPAARAMPEAVRIQFVAGYVDAASVPEAIKAWIKLRIGSLYEHRAAWTEGTKSMLNRNEFTDRLLDRYTAQIF